MRPVTATLVFWVMVIGAPSALRVEADDFSGIGVALLERWSAAVSRHAPGTIDAGVDLVTALTYEDRRLLDAPMRMFLSVLAGGRYEPDTDAQRKVDALARASRAQFGYVPFLKRAVILHTDAGVTSELHPSAAVVSPPHRPISRSPLLATRSMTVSRDGEVVGTTESNWNWPFARSLVAQINLIAPTDRFAADWYHATTAFMYSRRLYAEASVHLETAEKMLPEDPRILFDRAVYSENLGLPINQVLMRGVDLRAVREWRETGRLPATVNAATRAALRLDIPPKDAATRDAERLFRRALAVDPGYAEARVRLARLLVERKSYEEALGQIRAALAATPSDAVSFYGRLFGGRAAQALGRLDEAAVHFDEASRLFPHAESALLAQSQLALLRADVNATLAPVARLPRAPATDAAASDPWEYYRLGTGREWARLYRAVAGF